MDLGLEGRVVLVTGAGGGAGPAIVEAFAAEGATVAVHYRSAEGRAEAVAERVRAAGGRAIAVRADLADPAAVTAMVARIERELGTVAVLVNATSAYRPGAFAGIDDEAWGSVLDDVLGSTFRASRAVVPGMEAGGWGRIVNIAARSGLVGVVRAAHYGAAKAAVVGLTASLAKELGPAGILVNAIAPTTLLTEKDGVPSVSPERAGEMARSVPLRRLATSDDLARIAVWLGSGANTYVTGEVVSLHGGDQR
jgi:3-oxoacyl-[acyl-carrier protein] reductase